MQYLVNEFINYFQLFNCIKVIHLIISILCFNVMCVIFYVCCVVLKREWMFWEDSKENIFQTKLKGAHRVWFMVVLAPVFRG